LPAWKQSSADDFKYWGHDKFLSQCRK
jgi:hypothetical protein